MDDRLSGYREMLFALNPSFFPRRFRARLYVVALNLEQLSNAHLRGTSKGREEITCLDTLWRKINIRTGGGSMSSKNSTTVSRRSFFARRSWPPHWLLQVRLLAARQTAKRSLSATGRGRATDLNQHVVDSDGAILEGRGRWQGAPVPQGMLAYVLSVPICR